MNSYKSSKLLITIVATVIFALSSQTAFGHAGYIQQFNNHYPTSQTGNAGCAMCHSDNDGGSPWNAYGRDLLANGGAVGGGGNLVPALLAVESINSDAIAGNNLSEIQSDAQPGWCDPATAGCINQLYNSNGSNAGVGSPPGGILLDDDTISLPEPNIQISQASVNFGPVLIGQSASSTVIINNTGQADLVLSAMDSGTPFTIVSAPAATVAGGGSTSVVVSYTPGAVSADNGALTILSNDPDSPLIILDLAGSGVTELPDQTGVCPIGNEILDPIPTPIVQGGYQIGLQTVADGFVNPVLGVAAPDDSERLFVIDQPGQMWAVNLDTGDKSVFLDLSARMVTLGLFGINYDERGFLGATFAPDYFDSGLIYTHQSEPADVPADFSTMPAGIAADHQGVVTEWRVPNPEDPTSVVDPNSARVLIRIDQPQFNHNGGAVVFGPDKMLYISVGDGGGADDQGSGGDNVGHSPAGNGQDTSNVLGTVLRIDPQGDNAPNGQYGIPEGNPFVDEDELEDGDVGGQAGCADNYCDEIYAYGFRNPWRVSFDDDRDEVMMVADVGQNDIEEVDMVRSGGNYGWRIKDGSFCFDDNGTESGFVTDAQFTGPPDIIDPVAQYDHDEGISITGGFVYRGKAIKRLRGHYVFGDWAPSFTQPLPGRLFYLENGELEGTDDDQSSGILEFQIPGSTNGVGTKINGFGQDADGEIYVIGSEFGLLIGNTGRVQKLIPISKSRKSKKSQKSQKSQKNKM
jgi:glucose/arabinose dehydrogenase